MRARSSFAILGLVLAAACAGPGDPGPHDIDGWIGQCEDRCRQEQECEPAELVFYHGDLDNCVRDCGYYLDTDFGNGFVEETDAACLEALYDQVGCVFHLSCDDLDLWEEQEPGAPCADEDAAAAAACAGIAIEDFLVDCGWPQDAALGPD